MRLLRVRGAEVGREPAQVARVGVWPGEGRGARRGLGAEMRERPAAFAEVIIRGVKWPMQS